MNSNAFVKGEALAKLIELVGSGQKALDAKDAEIVALIDEVREMFKSDEQTIVTHAELLDLMSNADIEPGHKYAVSDDNAYITGATTSTLEPIGIVNDKLSEVTIKDGDVVYAKLELGGSGSSEEFEEITADEVRAMFES